MPINESKISNNAKTVLTHIFSRWRISRWHADQGDTKYKDYLGVFAYYSDEDLGDETGLHRTTVVRIRRGLIQAGMIKTVYTGRGLKYYLPDPDKVERVVQYHPNRKNVEDTSASSGISSVRHQMSQIATAADAFCNTNNIYNPCSKVKAGHGSLLRGMTVSEEDYSYDIQEGDDGFGQK